MTQSPVQNPVSSEEHLPLETKPQTSYVSLNSPLFDHKIVTEGKRNQSGLFHVMSFNIDSELSL